MTDMEARLDRLESIHAIEQLVIKYGLAVDDHDLTTVVSMFAEHGVLRTATTVKGDGRDGVRDYFSSRFEVLGPTNHFVHGHVIEFSDADRATGIVSSHAEVVRDGMPMITALRYLDEYQRVDGDWLFTSRTQTYMYFVDVRDYPAVISTRDRVRVGGGEPLPADWPSWLNDQ